jgi:predicted dehydrogenase
MHTIEEARTAVKTAIEKGITNAVNYHNRFYPAPNHLKNLIRDGQLGDIDKNIIEPTGQNFEH